MKRFRWLPFALGLVVVAGCTPKTATAPAAKSKRVVLYCSIDDVYAKPLIAKLKMRTGLDIVPLFDTESTKTAGLTTRIRSEKNRPRADVFWSSALLQTLLLSQDGLLEPYDSPAARDLRSNLRGDGWAGVGTRARVVVKSGDLTRAIDSLTIRFDTLDKTGHSNPQFGTASDEAAALYTRDPDAALKWYRSLKAAKTRITPGNGDVARAVADGDLRYGWTDTDDYLAQKKRGKPIVVAQTKNDNVLVPGAVALIKGAPNPENARILFDAIASKQGEADLIAQMPGVFSLRGLEKPNNWKSGGEDFGFLAKAPRDDYAKWPASWAKIREPLAQLFAP